MYFFRDLTIAFPIVLIWFFYSAFAFSQQNDSASRLRIETTDTSSQVAPKKNSSSLDTIVTYYARDTASFSLGKKRLRLKGNSNIIFGKQKIESEIITIYFDKSELYSTYGTDTAGKNVGYPKFTDDGNEYVGSEISFNFKTKEGSVSMVETKIGDGYYFGSKIKKVSEDEAFIQNGCYTTCDKPHPHFYFGSPEMKVVAKDKIFIDPVILYVEDMPIFMLPLGLFFPSKGGTQSGIVVPSYFFSANRGVVLQNLGYYFAISDYFDTQVNIDIFSKGGALLKSHNRYNIRGVLDGTVHAEYGQTRQSSEDPFLTNWSFGWQHNHTIDPQTTATANLQFSSADFFRNVATDINSRVTQNLQSRASLSTTFDNGMALSINLNRDQNIITKEVTQTLPQVSLTIPNFSLLKPFGLQSETGSIKDIQFSYNLGSFYTNRSTRLNDSTFINSFSSNISHSPTINILTQKFGFFTVNPFVSMRAQTYFRRGTKSFNTQTNSETESFENGIFNEVSYSVGANIQTTLFGVINPNILGVSSIRHVVIPSIGWSFSPQLDNNGAWTSYFNPLTEQNVEYSRFSNDQGGITPRITQQNLNYNVINRFEMKVQQGDTLPDKQVELLTANVTGNYNFAADSLQFSDINISFRTPPIGFLNFTVDSRFTPYKDVPVFNSNGDRVAFKKINQFLASEGSLLHAQSIRLQMSASINSETFSGSSTGTTIASSTINPIGSNRTGRTVPDSTEKQEADNNLGERFRNRVEYVPEYSDLFGENSSGYTPLALNWSATTSINYDYNHEFQSDLVRRTVLGSVNFSLRPTQTWSVEGNFSYDFITGTVITPQINLRKDLHCWDLIFTWTPIGFSQGFYLRFGIKSPQMRDLQLEKRSLPIFR